jgi:hypothetical protein
VGRRLSNRTIVIAVGLTVFLLSYLGQPSAAGSGFEASRQLGYAFGQALVVAVITWAILRYMLKRT